MPSSYPEKRAVMHRLYNWNSSDSCVKAEIIVPGDNENILLCGVIEDSEYSVGEIVQLKEWVSPG